MTSRQRVRAIFARQVADRTGFWLGFPHGDSWPAYFEAFDCTTQDGVRRLLGDDLRWIVHQGEWYKHPQGKPVFDFARRGRDLSAPGVFADCESVQQVDDFPWPNVDYLDFTEWLEALRAAGDVYRASGFWCPFFHEAANFFGMENYFVKMFTHPEVVHAVTRHMVDFYLQANDRLYDLAGDLIDGFFFGNDFGTQLDLLVGPSQLREFVFPYFRQLTDQAHARGYQVILHSCGAIHGVIGDLLDMGVDALHPLQALAAHMDAETLARDFGGRVAFMGGIDTQHLLVHGSPAEVRADVRRVRRVLGPHVVISPSHEAILPNVPPANVRAMAEAATE
jgi:uroporphyrinogen decarboxylase